MLKFENNKGCYSCVAEINIIVKSTAILNKPTSSLSRAKHDYLVQFRIIMLLYF